MLEVKINIKGQIFPQVHTHMVALNYRQTVKKKEGKRNNIDAHWIQLKGFSVKKRK